MVIFGVGELLGGLTQGYIIDYVGSKKTCFYNVVLIAIQGVVTIISIDQMQYNWMTFLMCFIWGFQDSSINTHVNQICGFEFET